MSQTESYENLKNMLSQKTAEKSPNKISTVKQPKG